MTALLLGLFGSLHCAGMCGPLLMALRATEPKGCSPLPPGIVYHSGRLFTYAALGTLFGVIGQTFALVGTQQWLSIGAGVILLTAVLATPGGLPFLSAGRFVVWLKRRFAPLIHQPTHRARFLLGALNGLLPCGLVYAALVAATATGSIAGSVTFMLAFGLGTLPLLLAIQLPSRSITAPRALRLQKWIPAFLGIVAILLIRGMSLGIPYLSPDLTAAEAGETCTHPSKQ